MKNLRSLLLVAGIVASLVYGGCASKPSAEELKQLDDLKAEVSSLEREISSKESEKATLTKAIADKDAQLKQCMQDKEVTQQRLKGM
jgi:outer membrane murein-binding lipoprotein Lpp